MKTSLLFLCLALACCAPNYHTTPVDQALGICYTAGGLVFPTADDLCGTWLKDASEDVPCVQFPRYAGCIDPTWDKFPGFAPSGKIYYVVGSCADPRCE